MEDNGKHDGWIRVTLHYPAVVFREIADLIKNRVMELHGEGTKEDDKGKWRLANLLSDCMKAIERKLRGKW